MRRGRGDQLLRLTAGDLVLDVVSRKVERGGDAVTLTEYLPEGLFAIFVAPDDWLLDYECGVEYSLTIEGYTEHCDPTPVESKSWGAIKALYE